MDIIDKIAYKLKYRTNWSILFYAIAAFAAICFLGTLNNAHNMDAWFWWMLGEVMTIAISLAIGAVFHERYHFIRSKEHLKAMRRRNKFNRRMQAIKQQRVACEQFAAEVATQEKTPQKDDNWLPKFLMIAP